MTTKNGRPPCLMPLRTPGLTSETTGGVVTDYPTRERDSTGRDAYEVGAKMDAGKVRAGLVLGGFARALVEVSRVGTFGAAKYTSHGWRIVPDGLSRYTDAMYRHLLAEASGEAQDPESGLAHAAHAAWNALARLELAIAEKERPR